MFLRTLCILFLGLASTLTALAGPSEQTVNEMIHGISKVLPQGWNVSYDRETNWLEIVRDESAWVSSAQPNANVSEPSEKRKLTFAFRVLPEISETEYRRIQTENERTRQELTALRDELGMGEWKGDHFTPKTDAEKTLLAKYEEKQKSLHLLPDFHYRDVSLRWEFNRPNTPVFMPVDEQIFKEWKQVQEKVVSVLSTYENP